MVKNIASQIRPKRAYSAERAEELRQRRAEREERRQERIAEYVEDLKDQRIDTMLDKWEGSVPRRNRGFDFSKLRETKWEDRLRPTSVKAISSWAKDPDGFLIFSGSEGRGKTTLAVSIISDWIEHTEDIHRIPLYKSVPSLLNQFSFSEDSNTIRDQISQCSILLLDDVGAASEGITAHQKKMLWSVIDERWAEDLPTIMTTNMAINSNEDGLGLIDWFGESAWARIRDKVTHVEFTGESFRGRK